MIGMMNMNKNNASKSRIGCFEVLNRSLEVPNRCSEVPNRSSEVLNRDFNMILMMNMNKKQIIKIKIITLKSQFRLKKQALLFPSLLENPQVVGKSEKVITLRKKQEINN
jgi:hypothetical protein